MCEEGSLLKLYAVVPPKLGLLFFKPEVIVLSSQLERQHELSYQTYMTNQKCLVELLLSAQRLYHTLQQRAQRSFQIRPWFSDIIDTFTNAK